MCMKGILVVTLDCESGSKHFLKQLKKKVLNETTEPSLSLESPLLDVPHITKTFNASFAN